MQRITLAAIAVLFILAAQPASADWNLTYSGYQPWWNIFSKRNKNMTAEEERLQKFWHDYYDSLRNYYSHLDRIDWVQYYKNHGYQINDANCPKCQRINYAPVFVTPSLQWAVSNPATGVPPAPGNVRAPIDIVPPVYSPGKP